MEELEPNLVWSHFQKITEIPRCSGNEEEIRDYIISVAEDNGYETKVDNTGNVVVKKPATTDTNAPVTVLQGHMDMVCEKDESSDHDFSKDPIPWKREGDWITAEGTTLGADNGIGIAFSLGLIEKDDLAHGPFEFLFTVGEETGLDGAKELKPGMLEGKTLINLDSEEFGSFTIGCAGSGDSKLSLPLEFQKTQSEKTFELSITGLHGGHSGLDIDKGGANAIKVLGRLLWELNDDHDMDFKIYGIQGGNKRNAIPREAKVIFGTKTKAEDKVKQKLMEIFSKIKNEYESVEENMQMTFEETDIEKSRGLSFAESKKVIDLIRALPHGVMFMSQEVPDLVRTSTNLAVVSLEEEGLNITMMTRSSSPSELKSIRDRIKTITKRFGGIVDEDEAYPGWEPQTDSDILRLAKKTYEDLTGEEPNIEALHAGLETALIGEKFEEMDMISMGATIENPHSTDERLEVDSVGKTWDMIVEILENKAK
ncbi:MAG: aminoacyl-histidine dipeptidase [Thermoplasmata archaeon]